MKIIVGQHKIEIAKEPVNEREIDISKCEFEFDEAITSEYVKEAYFTLEGNTYKQIIVNNECDIPSEVLVKKGTVEIGVVAFLVENEEEIKRYNPSPAYFNTWVGSLKDNAENSEPVTPTDKEQMEQALQDGLNSIDDKLGEVDDKMLVVDGKIEDIDTAITQTNNLNIDVNKVDKTTQVDLTKKDGTTKTVYINDGTSLQFMWQGTSLGIKTDDMEQYVFVDLQGIQGQPGPQGEPFRIKKEYTSVAEMNADFDNMNVGDYVMIASTVEIEDNAKLYVKGDSQWIFITDFSGATGIKGETGATPIIRIGTVTSGSTPSVTISGTAEEPVFNFVLQPGEKGEKGDTGSKGDTGNGIASIVKTASAGLIDTYTITFTDGTTSTFNVTNGADGDVTQEYVDEENERLKSVFNVLPKVSDSGESIELENTGDTMIYKMDLKGNTSQEVIQGEVGLEEEDTSIYVDDVNEDKENYITLKGNTYQESTSGKNLLPDGISSQTINNLTITKGSDGSLLINGTSNATTILIFGEVTLQAGTYTLSTYKEGTVDNSCYISSVNTSTGSEIAGSSFRIDNSNSKTYTLSETTTISYRFYTGGSRTFTNFKIYPMVEVGSSVTDYEPYTNGASPNPDYPQEIEVVTGLNEVKVEGKNLLDTKVFKNRMINCYVVNSNGTITQTATDTNFWQTSYMPNSIVLNKGTYTISVTNRNGRLQVYNLTTNSNIVEASVDSYTFTLNDDNQVINVKLYGASSYPFTFTMQIEKGSQATTYEAYKGATYEVNLGKNLFDKDNANYVNLTVNTADMRYYNASDNRAKLYYIKCKPNTTYTYSKSLGSFLRICSSPNIPEHNGVISVINSNITGTSTTITTGANDNYISIYPLLTTEIDTVGYDNVLSTIQIEQGDKATSYAPYFTPIELCKIGTYQDYFYKNNGNWYLHKEIGKAILDGTENWKMTNGGTQNWYYIANITSKLLAIILTSPFSQSFLSNQYVNADITNNNTTTGFNLYSATTITNIRIRYGIEDTIENFKNNLATNNLIVYAPLQTPTDTQITDTALVNQLEALYQAQIHSTTHINTETSNLLPYIDLKYNVVTASPSPDRASEVEVVKGNNTITISNEDGTKTQSYNLTLGNLELCKIGDYQDKIYKSNGNWYLHKEIGKLSYSGNDYYSFTVNSVANDFVQFLTPAIDIIESLPSSVLCNYSVTGGSTASKKIRVNISHSVLGTTSSSTNSEARTAFINKMSGKTMVFYYPLETPTQTQITDQLLVSQLDELQKAMSYYDKTLITQTNAKKPFILDVVGIRDLQDIFNL